MRVSIAELPGLVIAALTLDRIGRKICMEILIISGFLLLLPLVVHQNDIMTTGFLFGARMFVSANFTVACIYAPEVYPLHLCCLSGKNILIFQVRVSNLLFFITENLI